MNKTTIALFQSSLQTTDHWLTEIMRELSWTDRRKAYAALRATLHALRDHMPMDECAQLTAQLPLLLRGVYWEGWDPEHTNGSVPHHPEFLPTIHAAFKHDPGIDPEHVARAVFKVMADHIAAGEMDDVRGILPKQLRKLMPEVAAPAAR